MGFGCCVCTESENLNPRSRKANRSRKKRNLDDPPIDMKVEEFKESVA